MKHWREKNPKKTNRKKSKIKKKKPHLFVLKYKFNVI